MGEWTLIPLSKGKFAKVSTRDEKRVKRLKWHVTGFSKRTKNILYARNVKTTNGRTEITLLHRFILRLRDPKIKVDHKDRDGLNCTRENLRIATHAQNMANQMKKPSQPFKGVHLHYPWAKKKFVVRVGGKHIGVFASDEEAARAYDAAAREAYGEFARLNFPQEGERSAR